MEDSNEFKVLSVTMNMSQSEMKEDIGEIGERLDKFNGSLNIHAARLQVKDYELVHTLSEFKITKPSGIQKGKVDCTKKLS
jgi:hypothetical protein